MIQTQIDLLLTATDLNSPVQLISPPNDNRKFVVDRIGIIKIIDTNEVFLDLSDKMVSLRERFDERGLLSMAFHPKFPENKRFYVYYSAPLRKQAPQDWDHTSHISEFKVSDENPNQADKNSEKIIMQIDEPQFNHNGGSLAFGPDGYLYIGVGDGGQANDQGLGHPEIGNAQDVSTLLGSILRINIDSNESTYLIPQDNPFAGRPEGRDEIFAYGFRNPYKISFDSQTGDLFVADVGQNLWEEVNLVVNGGNYGWNIKEGSHCFSPENPDQSPEECRNIGYMNEKLIDPILEYQNANAEGGIGLSVIGGYVYRGEQIPKLDGVYIFGDWSSNFEDGKGKIFTANKTYKGWEMSKLLDLDEFVLGFGKDMENELYVLTNNSTGPTGNTGKVYKIIEKSAP